MFHVKRVLAAALVLTAATPTATAQEAPAAVQGNVGMDLGIAGAGSGRFWERSPFFLGARGDALFGRTSNRSWGVGPMGGVATYAFHDWSAQLGASLLIPVHEYLPFVLTAGGYVRNDGRWNPGAFGALFWGDRSFNYHSSYVLAAGLVVEARAGFGDERERTLILAAHVDGEIIALPAIFLLNALR